MHVLFSCPALFSNANSAAVQNKMIFFSLSPLKLQFLIYRETQPDDRWPLPETKNKNNTQTAVANMRKQRML